MGSNPLEVGKRVLTNSKHTYNAAQAKLPTFLFLESLYVQVRFKWVPRLYIGKEAQCTLFFYNLSFIIGVGLQVKYMWFEIRREKAFRNS
jgi:hypothetical protein